MAGEGMMATRGEAEYPIRLVGGFLEDIDTLIDGLCSTSEQLRIRIGGVLSPTRPESEDKPNSDKREWEGSPLTETLDGFARRLRSCLSHLNETTDRVTL